MLFPEIERGLQKLLYLRNDGDEAWGEFKTQPSRITNTSEAIWCIANVNNKIEISKGIEFIINAISNPGSNDPRLCEISRDFAWSILALSSADKLENISINNVIEYYKEESRNVTNQGFGARIPKWQYSVLNTSIVLLSLLEIYQKTNKASDLQEDILKLIENSKDSLLKAQNREDWGWGETINLSSDSGHTCYAIYALSRYESIFNNGIRPYIEKAIAYIEVTDLDRIYQDNDSRPDNRPYRHHARAWLLLGLNEPINKKNYLRLRIKIANELINYRGAREGAWNGDRFNSDPLTWATAISILALYRFYKDLEVRDLLDAWSQLYIENFELLRNKGNIFNKINLFFSRHPIIFGLIIVLALISFTLLLYPIINKVENQIQTTISTIIGLSGLGTTLALWILGVKKK